MKKLIVLIAVALPLLFPFTELRAQAAGTIYSVQTRYVDHQLDSAERAVLAALLQDYHTKVTLKNEHVLSERTMWHYWSVDSRELVTIAEFADWASIEKAGDRDEELEKQAWPDARQRADFMKKLNGYFSHHKDALYSGLPKLKK